MLFPSPENTLGTYYLLVKEGYTKVCYCQMHIILGKKKINISTFNWDQVEIVSWKKALFKLKYRARM